MAGTFKIFFYQIIDKDVNLNFELLINKIKETNMANKIDKETREHKLFYENFLKFTTFSTIVVVAVVALMAIFLV